MQLPRSVTSLSGGARARAADALFRGAPSVLKASRARFPFIETVFADGVYAGEQVAKATAIAVKIVRRLPD